MKKVYSIEVDCGHCALKMEEAVKATEGVKDASVNYLTLKMKVEFLEGADVDAVMKAARKACKRIESDCEIYF